MPSPLPADGRRRLGTRIGAALSSIFLAGMAVVAAGAFLGRETLPSPATIIGKPVRAPAAMGERVFIVTTQWRVYSGGWGRGAERPTFAGPVTDIWAFDAASVRPVWRHRVAVERAVVYSGRAILGVEDGILWLLHSSGVHGRSVDDGEVLIDVKRIEAANANLRGALPTDPTLYRFDAGGLAFTSTDGRKFRMRRDLVARPDAQEPQQPLPGVFQAARIAQGSSTSAFERQGFHPTPTRWVGLLSPQALAGFRDQGRRGLDWEANPRMRLWSARPKRPPDGITRTEYAALAPLPQSPEFLQPALLGRGEYLQDAPPLQLSQPDGVLVLHRSRLGARGHLRLSRVDTATGKVAWTADLPIQRLEAVMPGQSTLVLYGHREEDGPKRRPTDQSQAHVDHLVAIDLKTGAVSSYGLKIKATAPGDIPLSSSAPSAPGGG